MKKVLRSGVAAVVAFLVLTGCSGVADQAQPTPRLVLPASMASLGDSITQAAQADGTFGNQPDQSWSTGRGTHVDSLVNRISAESGVTVESTNAAVSGAVSADLADQAATAVSSGAEFVTILVGSNDVCNSSSVDTLPTPADYSANIRAALVVLSEGLPESKILLASMPSIDALYTAGKDDPAAKQAWTSYGVCPIALANPDSLDPADVQRREAVERRVTEMNASLGSVAGEFTNVLFDSGRVQEVEFTLGDLSTADFFHPSVAGQNLLVDVEWSLITEAGLFEVPETDDVDGR
jgi:lysophospholipase L1-like esterase